MHIVLSNCHGEIFEAKKDLRKALDGEYFELTIKTSHKETNWTVSRIHTSNDGTKDYWVIVSTDMQVVTFGMNVIWKAMRTYNELNNAYYNEMLVECLKELG